VPPRTSQPPPGDFPAQCFEFLLAHHERVIDVSLGRALSGRSKSATGAAAPHRREPDQHIRHQHCAGAQGLAGPLGCGGRRRRDSTSRRSSRVWLGCVSRTALLCGRTRPPLCRARRAGAADRATADAPAAFIARVSFAGPMAVSAPMGGLWGHDHLPERFARTVRAPAESTRRYRLIVGHLRMRRGRRAGSSRLARPGPQHRPPLARGNRHRDRGARRPRHAGDRRAGLRAAAAV